MKHPMKEQYNREKSIAFTGTSGLCAYFSGYRTDFLRIADVMRLKDYDEYPWEVFINHGHRDYDQSEVLYKMATAWADEPDKIIINISSRAAFPNLTQDHMYGAQKASLDHLANNLTYNSTVKCRITTLNLGMIIGYSDTDDGFDKNGIPGCTWEDVGDMIQTIMELPSHIEIPQMTMQHRHPYKLVQEMKENIKCNQ